MVDTVPWVDRGSEHLHRKVLLGGILRRIDDEDLPAYPTGR